MPLPAQSTRVLKWVRFGTNAIVRPMISVRRHRRIWRGARVWGDRITVTVVLLSGRYSSRTLRKISSSSCPRNAPGGARVENRRYGWRLNTARHCNGGRCRGGLLRQIGARLRFIGLDIPLQARLQHFQKCLENSFVYCFSRFSKNPRENQYHFALFRQNPVVLYCSSVSSNPPLSTREDRITDQDSRESL